MNNNNNKKPNSAKSRQLTLHLTLLCLRVTSAGARVRSLLLWPPPVPANYTILPCCWQSNYNPITLSMHSKHWPWKINLYLAPCALTYHLKSILMTRRKVLDKMWVLYRPLATNSIMERVNHGPYNLPASRGTPL